MSNYGAFVKAKHERLFNAPEEVIVYAIEKATGSKIAFKERIVKGEANEVHSILTEDGQEVIIRISHGNEPAFDREAWAIEQSSEIGVSVPKVLLVDEVKDGEKSLALCVETKLPGIPMDEVVDLLAPQNEALLVDLMRQAGEVLSHIHSIEVNGFGELDNNGKGKCATIQEVLLGDYIIGKDVITIADKVNLAPEIVAKALDILRSGASAYPAVQAKLIHNDYGPKHLLIDNHRISGVIDFENAEGGDPIKEFARWKFFFNEKYPLDLLKDGYTNKELFSENFDQKLNIWMIHLSLASLHYYYKENNTIGIDLAKRKLVECVS